MCLHKVVYNNPYALLNFYIVGSDVPSSWLLLISFFSLVGLVKANYILTKIPIFVGIFKEQNFGIWWGWVAACTWS